MAAGGVKPKLPFYNGGGNMVKHSKGQQSVANRGKNGNF